MSRYLLDTDTSVELLRGRKPHATRLLAAHRQSGVVLSVITVAELFFGAYRSTRLEVNLRLCEEFCAGFEVLPLTAVAARESAIHRAELEAQGLLIGAYDLLIAGIALTADLILITHNTREFQRVRGLRLEDWLGES